MGDGAVRTARKYVTGGPAYTTLVYLSGWKDGVNVDQPALLN